MMYFFGKIKCGVEAPQQLLESDNRRHSHTAWKSPPFSPILKLLDKSMVSVKPPENKLQETML